MARTLSAVLFHPYSPLSPVAAQEEFESVKAASQVAAEIAPAVVSGEPPRKRKRDAVIGAWRRAKALIGMKKELQQAVDELVADECVIDEPEECLTAGEQLRTLIAKTLRFSRGSATEEELASADAAGGDSMEEGWQSRSQGSALKRTLEVWGFAASSALKVLKAGKTKGDAAEVSAAKTAAAEFIRDGLFRLGPTFVKLGQVVSTRTDILEKEYIEVLRDLQVRWLTSIQPNAETPMRRPQCGPNAAPMWPLMRPQCGDPNAAPMRPPCGP